MKNNNFLNETSLSIRCISHPNFDVDSFFEFLSEENLKWRRTPNASSAEEIVEVAGRICYMSFGKTQSNKNNASYIKNLIDSEHESVLEHVSWTFILTGVSRAFTHQLVRHRVGFAFSQLSQQYHEENNANVVVPPYLKQRENLYEQWGKSVLQDLKTYRILSQELELDENNFNNNLCRKEQMRQIRSTARSVLPNAIESKILVTANARAMRHFLKVRGALEGDWEMRVVSTALYRIVSKDSPALFQDFAIEILPDGSSKVICKTK